MKVKELIDALSTIPEESQDAEIALYVAGRISGFLDIDQANTFYVSNGGKVYIRSQPVWGYDS